MFWRCEQTAWYFKRPSTISLTLYSLPFTLLLTRLPSLPLRLPILQWPNLDSSLPCHLPWHFYHSLSSSLAFPTKNQNTVYPQLWCHHCGPPLLPDSPTIREVLHWSLPSRLCCYPAAGVNNEQTWSSTDKAVHHGMHWILKEHQGHVESKVRSWCPNWLCLYMPCGCTSEWFSAGPGYCSPGRKRQLTVAPPCLKIKPPAHLFSPHHTRLFFIKH